MIANKKRFSQIRKIQKTFHREKRFSQIRKVQKDSHIKKILTDDRVKINAYK